MHNQNLKTDAKDAVGITDLVAQGHFVSFPFMDSVYADLRCLVSTQERLSLLRRGTITRLKATLEVVFPEYERIFVQSRSRPRSPCSGRIPARTRCSPHRSGRS